VKQHICNNIAKFTLSKMKLQIATLLITALQSIGLGQPPKSFVVKFGGIDVEYGYDVKEIYHRQYIVVGSTSSYGSGAADMYIILIDSMGQTVWDRVIGGTNIDVANSAHLIPADSSFLITGFTSSEGNGGYGACALRLDVKGNLIWKKSYDAPDWEFGYESILLNDSTALIVGVASNARYGKEDGLVLKININSGALIWKKYFGGKEHDEFNRVDRFTNGKILISGNSSSYGDTRSDFWLFNINEAGDSLKSITRGTPQKKEWLYDVQIDHKDDILLAASIDTTSEQLGQTVAYMYKLDSSFQFKDSKKEWGKGTSDRFTSVAISKDNFYLFTRRIDHAANGIDIQLNLCYDNFVFIVAEDRGGLMEDEAFRIIPTSDKGYAAVGIWSKDDSRDKDLVLIKLDSQLVATPLVLGLQSNKGNLPLFYYFNETLYYSGNDQIVTVYNTEGKLIFRGQTTDGKIYLNLSSGLYTAITESPQRQLKRFLVE
jgi:hypothetical protein